MISRLVDMYIPLVAQQNLVQRFSFKAEKHLIDVARQDVFLCRAFGCGCVFLTASHDGWKGEEQHER